MGCTGSTAPCPIRLGGTPEEGWTAEQHARACADLVAAWRSAPLAVVFVDALGNILTYLGRNGNGLAYAPAIVKNSTGNYTLTWLSSYATGLRDEYHQFIIRNAEPGTNKVSTAAASSIQTVTASSVTIATCAAATATPTDVGFRVVVYGDFGPPRTIADYGGALDKQNNTTEHPESYAAQIYRDIQQQRGTAYTKSKTSFVHAENLATARMWASVGYRLPEKLRANLTPRRSDDGLEYWSEVLGVGRGPEESRSSLRTRCAIQYRTGQANNYPAFQSACSDLLGPAFVSVSLNGHGVPFSTPSVNTYWPNNPGSSLFDLGGGAWYSDRLQVTINVARPGGMSEGEFNQLVNVSLFQLVDQMLPIWATAKWSDSSAPAATWDSGALWDDGTEWSSLFDWNG